MGHPEDLTIENRRSFYRNEAKLSSIKVINNCKNADKTKYMFMSRDQNAGRSHSMKIGNSCIERVEEFKYLGATLTSKNSIQAIYLYSK